MNHSGRVHFEARSNASQYLRPTRSQLPASSGAADGGFEAPPGQQWGTWGERRQAGFHPASQQAGNLPPAQQSYAASGFPAAAGAAQPQAPFTAVSGQSVWQRVADYMFGL